MSQPIWLRILLRMIALDLPMPSGNTFATPPWAQRSCPGVFDKGPPVQAVDLGLVATLYEFMSLLLVTRSYYTGAPGTATRSKGRY